MDRDAGEQAQREAERLLRLLPRFQRWAATAVQVGGDGLDLSLRQLAVLYLIREGAAFPSELARQLRISPAVVTGLLDRLEQRGYVQRRAEASDRRRLRLELTAGGLAASLAVEQMLSRDIAGQLGHVPSSQREALAQALDLLESVIAGLERSSPRLGLVAIEDQELWEAPERPVAVAGVDAAVG